MGLARLALRRARERIFGAVGWGGAKIMRGGERLVRKEKGKLQSEWSDCIRKGHSKGRDEQGKRNETEIELCL